MADQLERLGALAGDELDAGIAGNGIGEIDDDAVELGSDGFLGERRRDGLGYVEAGDAGVVGALGAIGEGQDRHVSLRSLLPTEQVRGGLVHGCGPDTELPLTKGGIRIPAGGIA